MTTSLKSKVLDAAERAGWSAGQALVAVLLTAGTISDAGHSQLGTALGTAVGAFVVSVVATTVLYVTPLRASSFRADLGLRLAKTFVSAFGGAIGVDAFNAFTFDWGAALNVALLATLGAFGKGLLAREETPGGNNPSSLTTATYRLSQHEARASSWPSADEKAPATTGA